MSLLRRRLRPSVIVTLVLIPLAGMLLLGVNRSHKKPEMASSPTQSWPSAGTLGAGSLAATVPTSDLVWRDSVGDGLPDGARLDASQDRDNFIRWLTFLAESQYYRQSARTREEIQDCAALIRYAYRNALMAHSPAWRQLANLPFEPGFGDVEKYVYPTGPLGRGLFRTRPGPFVLSDLERRIFAEFADSATLWRYNVSPISRDIRAARPGDLLFFHQPTGRQPYHSMLFVGRSHFQPHGSDWIVYHTGDLEGRRGEIREVQAGLLTLHPDPRWRPLIENPRFLGVYRFNVLR